MNIDAFFLDLAQNPSRNYKIEQLSEYSSDQTLKKVVKLALDPFTQFYIRKIPDYTPANVNQADSLDSVLDSLYNLYERKVTGNAGIEFLTKLLSSLVEHDAKVVERIIQKDLKCGVSIATANAVWPNLISEFPVMLCSGYEQKLVDKVSYPAITQRKEDGMRFAAIVKDNVCEFRSRNGKQIELLGNLEQEFIKMADGQDLVFDGELLVVDSNGVYLDRKTGNGILNQANKGTISESSAKKVRAIVWDLIVYNDFLQCKSLIPYRKRFDDLKSRIKFDTIKLVETYDVPSLQQAREIFQDYIDRGFEGIILKDPNGIWEDKRVKHQIKFKSELECDLKVVGVQLGTGKYQGLLGSLLLESNDSLLKVSVGSGFSDDQRKELLEENLLGKIVAVKYNTRITNKAGEESLFLPIFVEIRNDKDVADSINEIK